MDPSYEYLVVDSFGLYFVRHNCSLQLSQFMTALLFFVSHCKYFSLDHSRIAAAMHRFFGNVSMTVVDTHTCSSPVVIKLGAICVAVDLVIDRWTSFVGISITKLGPRL